MYDYSFKYIGLSILLVCCQFIAIPALMAQDKKKVDSLTQLLQTKEKKARIDIVLLLTLQYYDVNNRQALAYAEDAFQLAEKYGDSLQFVKAGRIKGLLLRRADKLDESIKTLKTIEPIAQRNSFKLEYKKILNALALSYTYKANYDEALKYNFKSLLIREEDGNKEEISIALNNIGVVYLELEDHEKALHYFKKSLKLKKEINDNYDLDRLLVNIGLCLYNTSNYGEARDYINEGLKVCGDHCSDQIKVEALTGLGTTYYNESKFEEAKKYFAGSLEIARNLGNKRFQIVNLLFLARIHEKLSQNNEAKNLLTLAETIASGTKYNQLLTGIYFEFAHLFYQSKEFEQAAAYQKKYISLKDSVYSQALIKNLAKVQTDFEERENVATIATKEEVIQQQRSINIAIGVITILAILLITVLYHSNKVKKRVNNALSEAKNIIELKNRELDKKVAEKTADLEKANQSLVKVNEELDNFIYKTSHDIRGPLASLKGICNVALMDVKDEVAIGYLSKLDLTAEHLNTILTRLLIINQINSSSMKPELINFNALIDEVLALERKKGLPDRITVKRHIDTEIKYYSDKEFIRIILENLIGNAIKFHNDSARVEPFVDIRVEKENEEVSIRVIDNGIGFGTNESKGDKIFQMFSRASERSTTGGIGLYITKTATEKLRGQVGLRTTTEGYTEFFVKFPIEPLIQRFESELV